MPKRFIERKTGTGWMNTLFSVHKTISQSQNLNVALPPAVRKKKKKRRKGTTTISDIGKPVLINRPNQGNGCLIYLNITSSLTHAYMTA